MGGDWTYNPREERADDGKVGTGGGAGDAVGAADAANMGAADGDGRVCGVLKLVSSPATAFMNNCGPKKDRVACQCFGALNTCTVPGDG